MTLEQGIAEILVVVATVIGFSEWRYRAVHSCLNRIENRIDNHLDKGGN